MTKSPPLSREERALLRRHRLWYYAAAAIALYGIYAGQALLFALALVTATLVALPEIWFHRGQRGVMIAQTLSATRAFMGDWVTLRLRVENHEQLPLPWVRVQSDLPRVLEAAGTPTIWEPRYQLLNIFALDQKQGTERTKPLFCAARGLHQLGPLTVSVADPLRWMERKRTVAMPAQTVLVFPPVVPLEAVNLEAMFPFGELPSKRRVIADPLRQAGVREYQRGDDPRYIHWKISARTGELMTKIFDPSGQYRLLLVLEANSFALSQYGVDANLLELSICVAASLALWALDAHFAVGILGNSPLPPFPLEETIKADAADTDFLWLAPSSQPAQKERILETLARVPQQKGMPITTLLAGMRQHFVPGTTVVYIGTVNSAVRNTVEYLAELRRNDLAMHLAIVGDRTALPYLPPSDLPMHYVGGEEVWNAIITTTRHPTADGNTTTFRLD